MAPLLGAQEIDFVASKDKETVYIQAALRLDHKKTMGREFGNLQKIQDNYPKMVITLDKTFDNSLNGIKHLSLRDFLMLDGQRRMLHYGN